MAMFKNLFKQKGALSLAKSDAPSLPVSDNLHRFNGGIHLPTQKDMSVALPLRKARLPKELVLPMQQHIGVVAEPIVKVGDSVLKGQLLAKAPSYVSAPIHAPTSGQITHIGEKPIPHSSGLEALCVTIEPDGNDTWCELAPTPNYLEQDKATLRNIIRDAGIVGLGGAAFPSAVKINPRQKIEKLIINGAECEPYITCDQTLMSERADEVIKGIQLLLHVLEIKECWIGIEDTMPTAFEGLTRAIEQANEHARIKVKVVPTIYPTGGEKQLIKVLTGKEVPSNGLPADIGLVCHNPGTAVAMYKAVALGEPLISRIVTVTGLGVAKPQNLEVLFGTPISHLVEEAGGYTNKAERLILGGPMMGFAMHNDALPIVKATNCVLVADAKEIQEPESVSPCIRCGDCASACPANLLPQQLYWFSKSRQFDVAESDYNLFDCIECGCCSYVCPSNIPLVQYYRFAKTEIRNANVDKQKAEKAKERHDFRNERIEREQQEKAEALRIKKEALAKKKADEAKQAETDKAEAGDNKQDLIAAAVARAKARKEALKADTPPTPTDAPESNDTSKTETLSAVEAAKARALAKKQAREKEAAETPKASTQQDAIAAAKARALAKKEAREESGKTDEPVDAKTAAIEAAKARALAKKQARENNTGDAEQPEQKSDAKQDAIAAAKARALAKKAEREQANQSASDNPAPSSGQKTTADVSDKQSAIEAAKARALAKKAEREQTSKNNDSGQNTTPEKSNQSDKSDKQSAIEAAKARALAKAKEKTSQADTPQTSAADAKKAAIEAAKKRALEKAKQAKK